MWNLGEVMLMRKWALSLCTAIALCIMAMPFSAFAEEIGESNENAVLMGTNGHTQADAIAWVQAQVGRSLDYDGAYGAQCVDLIAYYYQYLGATTPGGNGCDYATNALPTGWTRIRSASPQMGDILVYHATVDNPYGHVGIYESDYSHYDQNVVANGYPEHTVVRATWHYNAVGNYWGVIRPDWSGSSSGSGSGSGSNQVSASWSLNNSRHYSSCQWNQYQ